MPCNRPLIGYRSQFLNENGKREICFKLKDGFIDLPIKVPCGECYGCREQQSRDWALRIMHESKMHKENCFITLTYDPKHLPKGGSLLKRHFQLFMKKLRRKYGKGIRYFHSGEYGENFGRPHYHAVLFGIDFYDREVFGISDSTGEALYTSETLSSLWKKGFVQIGEVNFKSSAYIARYVTKKMLNTIDEDYEYIDMETGEILERQKEYSTMSKGKSEKGDKFTGIGSSWIKKYWKDCYPKDFVTHDGFKFNIPRYYDKWMEENHPEIMKEVKRKRSNYAIEKDDSIDPMRCEAKEVVKSRQLNQLKRNMEVGTYENRTTKS